MVSMVTNSPLPLNEWFGKHPLEPMEWQWFFSMATIGNNEMAMVFNGLQPLVKRWNGNDPSLCSNADGAQPTGEGLPAWWRYRQ